MFCYQCGAKLPDKSRFCPTCGAEIIGVDKPPQKQTTSSAAGLTIPLLGQNVQFDVSIELYVALRREFTELGDDISKEFSDTFRSEYHDMDAFVRSFPKNFSEMFKEAIDRMNELLSEIHIFGVTQDELAPYTEKYCCHTYLELQEIMTRYNEIVGEQEEMRQYRQARKDSRGRLVGGGFGLTGAAKGIMKAGAVNMATGALHSVGNAIGNMGSAISAANAKSALFGSGIDIYLASAIKKDILGVHLAAIDIINARRGDNLCKFTAEEDQSARKIQIDLEQGVIFRSSERAAVIRMLTTYPFQEDYYRTAVKLFPDEIESMRKFAAFFGFDIDSFYCAMIEQANPAVEILLEYREELENLLLDDLDYPEDDVIPLTTTLTDMLDYFGDIFAWADEDGFFFLPNEDEKGKSRLNGAKSAYANYGKETPLFLYDSTVVRSGKNGFLVTDQHVYLKGNSKAVKLSLHDALMDIHQGGKPSDNCTYLYFDDYGIYLLPSGDMVREKIVDAFVELVIALILFLKTTRPTEGGLWKAIAQYQQLPQSPKAAALLSEPEVCYCFECGAENDASDKFCCECGAELN